MNLNEIGRVKYDGKEDFFFLLIVRSIDPLIASADRCEFDGHFERSCVK